MLLSTGYDVADPGLRCSALATSQASTAACDNSSGSGHNSIADTGREERGNPHTGAGGVGVLWQAGNKAGNGCAADFGGENGGLGAIVVSLIELELEGVFRTVMGFL